jgi:hypothetical protein
MQVQSVGVPNASPKCRGTQCTSKVLGYALYKPVKRSVGQVVGVPKCTGICPADGERATGAVVATTDRA